MSRSLQQAASTIDRLRNAALNGHRPMVQYLLDRGADRNITDTKVSSTPAGWAEHGGHTELLDLLK